MVIDCICSFCNQRSSEVGNLIRGDSAYICNACIDMSYDLIHPKDIPSRNKDKVQIDIVEETVYRVIVQGTLGHETFVEMCKWTEETLLSYLSMDVHRQSFEFIFQNEGDAVAFKLRWL